MYLRRHRRSVKGIAYEYWTLVESRRTASGPRQHTVATLGKLAGLDDALHAGWESLDDLLEGRAPTQQLEFQNGKAAPSPPPLWHQVDVRGLRVERMWEFGQVYLGLSLWRRTIDVLRGVCSGTCRRRSRLGGEMLRKAGWTEKELRDRRKGDKRKVRMAARLRKETTMSWHWITKRLGMGHWRTASNAVRVRLKQ